MNALLNLVGEDVFTDFLFIIFFIFAAVLNIHFLKFRKLKKKLINLKLGYNLNFSKCQNVQNEDDKYKAFIYVF